MASKYDTDNIKTFDNNALEVKLENNLITRLDMNQFITVDYQLAEEPGMVKKVRVYSGTGAVEDLAMGAGNTGDIGSEFTETPYEVVTTQGRVPFYDEQQMNDPAAIDKAIQHLSEALTNDITTKVVAELKKGTGTIASMDFDGIVDAIAAMPDEENNDLYLLVSKKQYAALQKSAKQYISYVEDFVRRGYVGTIAGVPIYVSAACKDGDAFLAAKSAITCFMKKGVEVEQERDADKRKTTIFGRNVKVIAATNLDKIAKLGA